MLNFESFAFDSVPYMEILWVSEKFEDKLTLEVTSTHILFGKSYCICVAFID